MPLMVIPACCYCSDLVFPFEMFLLLDLDHVDEGTSIETLVRNMRMADRVQVLFHKLLSSNTCETQM